MKTIFLFIFLIMPGILNAQEWAPIGAKWYYNTTSTWGVGGLLTIESVKDIVIESHSCKKLEFVKMLPDITNQWDFITTYEFFYSEGDSIFHYDKENGYYYKLYDFSVETGDTVTVRDETFPGELPYHNFQFIVDSTSILSIDNTQLKTIYGHPTLTSDWMYCYYENGFDAGFPILERIGSTFSFLGIFIDEPFVNGSWYLRCYQDENIFYRSEYFPEERDCDYGPTALTKESLLKTLEIFPNPAQDYITIHQPGNEKLVLSIYSIQGILYIRQEISEDENIDVRGLSNGLYILQINTQDQFIESKLLIKL